MKKIFLIFLILNTGVFAKNVNITLKSEMKEMTLKDTFTLTLSVENLEDIDDIKIDGIENFRILTRNTSTQIRSFNFNMVSVREYNFIVLPKKKGEFFLKGTVVSNGKKIYSNNLKILVKDGAGNTYHQGNSGKELYIETQFGKTKLYFGEKTVLTYDLYSRLRVENIGLEDEIKFDNFISKQVDSRSFKGQYVTLNGVQYAKYELGHYILQAVKTGRFKLPSYQFQVNALVDEGFFGTSKPFFPATPGKEIEGLPAFG